MPRFDEFRFDEKRFDKRSRSRATAVIIGIVAITERLYLTYTRASSVLVGALVTAKAITGVQRAIVYIGLKVSATRNITKIIPSAATLIGIIASATRLPAYKRTATTIIGGLVTTVTRQWGRTRAPSVIIGANVTVTRKVALIRASSVQLGVVTSATRLLASIRKAVVKIGALISAVYAIVGRPLKMSVYGRPYKDMSVYSRPQYDMEVHQ